VTSYLGRQSGRPGSAGMHAEIRTIGCEAGEFIAARGVHTVLAEADGAAYRSLRQRPATGASAMPSARVCVSGCRARR